MEDTSQRDPKKKQISCMTANNEVTVLAEAIFLDVRWSPAETHCIFRIRTRWRVVFGGRWRRRPERLHDLALAEFRRGAVHLHGMSPTIGYVT